MVKINKIINCFNKSTDFIFILDLKGKIIDVNDIVYSQLNYNPEEIIGQNVLILHPSELRKDAKEIIDKMLQGKLDSCPIPLITKDGRHIPVDTRVFKSTLNSQDIMIGISRNLSDLKIAEIKFSKIFNLSPIMMLTVRLEDGHIVNANSVFFKTLNFNKDEVIGINLRDLDIFSTSNTYDKIKSKLENSGKLKDEEILLKTKESNFINCVYSIELIKTEREKYALVTAVNITPQKNAQKKLNYLLEQQKLLTRVSQLLHDIETDEYPLQEVINLLGKHTNFSRVYIFEDNLESNTTSNTFEWCNKNIDPQICELQDISYATIPSWKKILLDKGSIFSENIFELPDDIRSVIEPQNIKSLLILPIYVEDRFFGFIGFDECKKNIHWETENIELLKVVSYMISNYYERKSGHRKLVKSELKQKLAIESSKGALWEYNFLTNKFYLDDQFYNILGYNKKELIPLNIISIKNIIHQDDYDIINKSVKANIDCLSNHFDFTARVKSNFKEWKSILCRGIINERDTKGNPIAAIGIVIDITFQKHIEEQLKKNILIRDSLLSIISHDYLKPVGMFVPILDTIISEEDLDKKTVMTLLNEMKNTAATTYHMMENLLNWSKLKLKKEISNPVSFQVNEIILENIKLLTYSAKNKNISILKNMENNVKVYADKEAINIVIRNILSNAIKFTPINGEIHISTIYNVNNSIIQIKDNGSGISEQILEKILNESELISTRGTDNEKGNGIGLTICNNLIKENKGKMIVNSSPGKGSTFRIVLPTC